MTDGKGRLLQWLKAYNQTAPKGLQRTVLNAIATHADNYTLEAYPGIDRLADETGLSRRQVSRQIAANRDAGWLWIDPDSGSGSTPNHYRLTIPRHDTHVMPKVLGRDDTGVMPRVLGMTSMASGDDVDVIQTTQGTTHKSSSYGTTSRGSQSDPFGGSGGDYSPAISTTQRGDDAEGLPEHLEAQFEAFLAQPEPESDSPESRLLAAIADGPVAGYDVPGITGLDQGAVQELVRSLVERGVIVHDMAPGPTRNTLRMK